MNLNGDMDSFQAVAFSVEFLYNAHFVLLRLRWTFFLFLSTVYKVLYSLTHSLNLGESRPTAVFMNAKAQ